MNGHIKVTPSYRLIDFSLVLPPVIIKRKPVNRNAHFAQLNQSFNSAIAEFKKSDEFTDFILSEDQKPKHLVLTFKENIDIDERIAISTLSSHGMTLLSVNKIEGRTIANVSIPIEKLGKIDEIFNEYASKETPSHEPKHRKFVELISDIEFGNITSLWISSEPPPTDLQKVINVELWFDYSAYGKEKTISKINERAAILGITLKQHTLFFKDRVVKIACTSLSKLYELQLLLENLAEIRPAQTISNIFLDMKKNEAYDWIDSIKTKKSNNPIPICILDTGVNAFHPLLIDFTNQETIISAEPEWTANDIIGHGTAVAGLVLYGDLKISIQNDLTDITSTVESVKIIPDQGGNDPELYGAIIMDAVYNIEAIRPNPKRIFTMAVTSGYKLRGIPSSCSAVIDGLASGNPDDNMKRIFIISAGNMDPAYLKYYPESNFTSTIEDPANSYNSITVGYWASEDNIIEQGYRLLAELTDLGPSSTTSMSWITSSPFKPDIIFEGGNYGFDEEYEFAANLEELSLLTTSNKFLDGAPFSSFIETSAATALASNFISKLWSQYPDYRPETIRALMIHSASWPQKIIDRFQPLENKQSVSNLLRIAGYGQPDLSKALTSGDRSVNLVVEGQIQPYTPEGTMNKMVLYSLPWPTDELEKLGDQKVKLRVTLSYFIEPNPGERGWENKFKYTSHGLRFDLNCAGEESGEFVARINKKYRTTNPDLDVGDSDSSRWLLGPTLRNRGSIHSDIWTGTAVELADKKHIAVYPVSGWWKELKKEKRQSSVAQFSLIVSIETPENNLELHNKICQILNIDTSIQSIITI